MFRPSACHSIYDMIALSKNTAAACFQHVQPKSIHTTVLRHQTFTNRLQIHSFALVVLTTTFSSGSGNSCDCDWWRLVGPFGEISRVQHLALTDPLKSEIGGSGHWVDGSFRSKIALQPRFASESSDLAGSDEFREGWKCIYHAAQTNQSVACIHICTDIKVMGHGSTGPIFCKNKCFYYEWLLKSLHKPLNAHGMHISNQATPWIADT